MADPNTQIDWWIAQAWQEAQGGADSESLVAWLYDNGLTAVSSYTILQAALSCSPDEAKQMVFSHPVWADAEQEVDLSAVGYTSDTLEPEPEPDATFGLDDWADEIEEDAPVYGEPGYEPPPNAAPPLPAKDGDAPAPRNMLLDAYSEMAEESAGDDGQAAPEAESLAEAGEFDDAGAEQESPEPGQYAAEEPETLASPMTVDEPEHEPEPEPMAAFDQDEDDGDEPEIDADQVFEAEPEWEGLAAEAARAPEPEPEPEHEPEPEVEAELAHVPAGPPILRMPPTTPAQRAATFAAAFGKKSASGGGGPPQSETGPVAQAETAPALNKIQPPQPATAPVQMPPPLVLDPLPEIPAPQPAPVVEPLYTAAARREPKEAQPLFPPATPKPADDELQPPAPDEPRSASPEETEPPDQIAAADGREADPEEAVPPAMSTGETPDEQEVLREMPPDSEDLEAGPDDAASAIREIAEPPPAEPEQELPEPEEEEEIDEPQGDFARLDDDAPADVKDGVDDEHEEHQEQGNSGAENAAQARKRLLLDPDGENDPIDEGPESLEEAAKKLGINFRGPDPTEVGVDPEIALAAKKLGISFRGEDGEPELPDDEMALEAQKLGISFRDKASSSIPKKSMMARYMPIFLVIIALIFLLLLGVTFAEPLITWLFS